MTKDGKNRKTVKGSKILIFFSLLSNKNTLKKNLIMEKYTYYLFIIWKNYIFQDSDLFFIIVILKKLLKFTHDLWTYVVKLYDFPLNIFLSKLHET